MSERDEIEALFSRAGLPMDLTFLLQKYPRNVWAESDGLDDMAQFWLNRHNFFRELSALLNKSVTALHEEKLDAVNFAQWFGPRLELLLGELEGHHNVEDMHYFPLLIAAEPRLKRGFEILDADHHTIHDLLESNASAGRQFAAALVSGGDAASGR
ncbi:MAG: hemerythrin domain-containing protein [Pseudomonadota bacterium]